MSIPLYTYQQWIDCCTHCQIFYLEFIYTTTIIWQIDQLDQNRLICWIANLNIYIDTMNDINELIVASSNFFNLYK
jgi:hypothetical protein